MPYKYLEELTTADVAFEATGRSLEELFIGAAEATANTMVDRLDTVVRRSTRRIELRNLELDLLLFNYLQELIYYKDAEGLILVPESVRVSKDAGNFFLTSVVEGEEIDPSRHEQRTDVKAVTLHRFEVQETSKGWKAIVILDV